MKNIYRFLLLLGFFALSTAWADTTVVENKFKSKAMTQHKGKLFLTKENCDIAVELLGECSGNNLPCNQNLLTDYLLSSPRSTYVFLTKQKEFYSFL
jgi:hypothetical protein